MSNSYKKKPILKVICKDAKKDANKKVRRATEPIKSGCFYRKIFYSYDIIDQYSRVSKKQYDIDYAGNGRKFNWSKWYYRK